MDALPALQDDEVAQQVAVTILSILQETLHGLESLLGGSGGGGGRGELAQGKKCGFHTGSYKRLEQVSTSVQEMLGMEREG